MSGNPGQFSDLSKASNDLLTKIFPKSTGKGNSWGLAFEVKPTSYFTGGAKITNAGGSSTGEVNHEIDFADFGVNFKSAFKTDKPSLDLTWKVSEKLPIDGVSAKLHFNASSTSQLAGFSVAVAQEFFTLNGRVHIPVSTKFIDFVDASEIADQDTKLDLDFVAAHPDHKVSVGGLLKFAFPSDADRSVEQAKVTLGWKDTSFEGVLSYNQSKGSDGEDKKDISSSLFSKPADTKYVAQVDYSLDDQSTVGSFGFEYALNDGAIVKTKLDTNKNIGLAYSNQISSSTKVDFGALIAVNTTEKTSVESAFSFNLKFTQ